MKTSPFLQGALLCTSLNMYRDLIVHVFQQHWLAMHVYITEHTANSKSQMHRCFLRDTSTLWSLLGKIGLAYYADSAALQH